VNALFIIIKLQFRSGKWTIVAAAAAGLDPLQLL
jgi:hypothetical protein